MGSSRVEQALNELDPGSRAVVDLSLGTDFSDENIATLIRVEPDEVARRRDRAIDALQQKLGGASHDVVVLELCAAMGVEPSAAMLEDGLPNGSAAASPNGAAEVLDEPTEFDERPEAADHPDPDASVAEQDEPPASEQVETGVIAVPFETGETDTAEVDGAHSEITGPEAGATPERDAGDEEHEPERDRGSAPPVLPPGDLEREASEGSGVRRRAGAVLAAFAAAVLAVGGVIALSAGGDSGSEPVEPETPASSAPAETPTTEEPEAATTLDALPDAPAGGAAEVSLDGDRLTVTLDGLPAPEGTYEAWLFTSVLDSRALGTTEDGSGTIAARLPASADRYEYLDVSFQPSEDTQHSGQSIFRVPVADLLG